MKDFIFVDPINNWICKKRVGIFPAKLKIFKAERLRQKELGNKAKDHAFKILINGGYGLFGSDKYSYYDPRIAELVTAAGRVELDRMQNVANLEYGFEIIYGDTDSLFLNNTSEKDLKAFQDNFKIQHDIELEIKNRFEPLLLSAGKKHYIGYEKGQIVIVGFEGEKSDRPELFHKVFKELVEDILKWKKDPLPNLRKSMSDLNSNQIGPDLLKISKVLSRNPEDYKLKAQNSQSVQIGKALGKRKDELIEYFYADPDKTGKSWTLNFEEADIQHYKELLWNTISEILDIAGYLLTDLANEFGIRLDKDGRAKPKSKRKPKPKKNDKDISNNSIGTLNDSDTGGE